MPLVIGVDGCRGGWLAALLEIRSDDPTALSFVCARRLGQLLTLGAAAVAVDIPIGLPDDGKPRAADLQARARLRHRFASVFPAPPRAALAATSYEVACARASAVTGKRLTRQTYNLLGKIADADAAAATVAERALVEVHPEVTFALLAGRPVDTRKRTAAGRQERLRLLAAAMPTLDLGVVPRGNDAVDALAAAWSGLRWQRGTAEVLGDGRRDRTGRPMRIVV